MEAKFKRARYIWLGNNHIVYKSGDFMLFDYYKDKYNLQYENGKYTPTKIPMVICKTTREIFDCRECLRYKVCPTRKKGETIMAYYELIDDGSHYCKRVTNGVRNDECYLNAICQATNKKPYDVRKTLESAKVNIYESNKRVIEEYIENELLFTNITYKNMGKDNFLDFAIKYPKGEYIVASGMHIVYMKDGVYYDSENNLGRGICKVWKKPPLY